MFNVFDFVVRQVKNSEGPNDRMPSLREELWAELILEGRDYPRPEIGSKNVLMLEERVQELEEALDCKGEEMDIISTGSDSNILHNGITCLEYQIENYNYNNCYSNDRVVLN